MQCCSADKCSPISLLRAHLLLSKFKKRQGLTPVTWTANRVQELSAQRLVFPQFFKKISPSCSSSSTLCSSSSANELQSLLPPPPPQQQQFIMQQQQQQQQQLVIATVAPAATATATAAAPATATAAAAVLCSSHAAAGSAATLTTASFSCTSGTIDGFRCSAQQQQQHTLQWHVKLLLVRFCFVVAGQLMLHSASDINCINASLHSIHILVTHPSSIDVHVVQLAKHPAAAAVLVVPGCSLSIAH
eukprot:12400-Heterococcus_DN1.PRE.1